MAAPTGSFFRRQDRARRDTWLLMLYLLLAVVLIVVAVNAVVWGLAVFSGRSTGTLRQWLAQPWWAYTSLATVAIIVIGTVKRYVSLREGGRAVAEMMGARRIQGATKDLAERRLVNVVEEMAIASGTPVPALYVMEQERAINAFVAGYRPTAAVMVVTRGAIDSLSRDELQGVVGHEFSHILNGDMRLNLRLIAILAGILALGVVGREMMRMLTGSRRGGGIQVGGSSRSGRGGGAMFLLGLALFVIGYIGLFFGRLIKAAVSREREFLADASSVQFTRNPAGIAGALWKIQQAAGGSLLLAARAEDTSHMCFGQSIVHGMSGLMATHPPLDVRIQAVDPHFRGRKAAETIRERQVAEADAAKPSRAGAADAGGTVLFAASAAAVVSSVGNPTPAHVEHAARLHAEMPQVLLDAAHEPEHARWLVYALLLGDVVEGRERIARALIAHEDGEEVAAAASALAGDVAKLDQRHRLPLLELAIPALRSLDAEQRSRFLVVLDKLVRIDGTVTLFEFAVRTLAAHRLAAEAEQADAVRYTRFDPVLAQVRLLLTLLARAGTDDEAAARAAFDRAMRNFSRVALPPAEGEFARPEALGDALEELAGLSPLLKQPLIEACVDCVLEDGRVTVEESELLRAVAEALDCPMPPLLPAT